MISTNGHYMVPVRDVDVVVPVDVVDVQHARLARDGARRSVTLHRHRSRPIVERIEIEFAQAG